MTNSRMLSATRAAVVSGLLGILPFSAQATLIISEVLADPATGMNGDANGDGVRSSSADEFIELLNPSEMTIDISEWTLSDATGIRHVFPSATLVSPGETVVIFGGGVPTDIPGLVFTASTGGLGLNNSGDSITLSDGSIVIDSVAYGVEGSNDESLTRYPLLNGGLVRHSEIPDAIEALYTPGTSPTGMPYTAEAIPPVEPPTTAVSEPETFVLLLSGLVGLAFCLWEQPILAAA